MITTIYTKLRSSSTSSTAPESKVPLRMTGIPFPLSLHVKAVDMVFPTSEKPLNITGTYTLSPPLLTPRGHTATNSWTLSLHDFTYDICNGHPLWGVFSFGAFKGIVMVDRVETPPSAPASAPPQTEESGSELEEGEIRDPVVASTARSHIEQTPVHPTWSHTWKPGEKIHFRWRGSRDAGTSSSYSNEDFSPRKRRCFASTSGSETKTAGPLFGGTWTQSSIPRSPSWAGSGEIVFLDGDDFELVFRNQGEVWQLDGLRARGGRGVDGAREVAPWAIVDGYGKSWYELFWLAERRGDWRGDVDAELLERKA